MSKRDHGTGSIIHEKNGLAIRWAEYVIRDDGRPHRKMRYECLGIVSEEQAHAEVVKRITEARRAGPRHEWASTYDWLVPVCAYRSPSLRIPPPDSGSSARLRRLRPSTASADSRGRKCIYFVQETATGYVKIGCSTNVRRRMRSIQTHTTSVIELLSVLPVTDMQVGEAWFHRYFRARIVLGEWFRVSEDEIRAAIAAWEHQSFSQRLRFASGQEVLE